jgi:hypothetical protein
MGEQKAADIIQGEHAHGDDVHHTPGTMTLVLILLTCFAIYYFANWKALADVWHVR